MELNVCLDNGRCIGKAGEGRNVMQHTAGVFESSRIYCLFIFISFHPFIARNLPIEFFIGFPLFPVMLAGLMLNNIFCISTVRSSISFEDLMLHLSRSNMLYFFQHKGINFDCVSFSYAVDQDVFNESGFYGLI